MKMLYFRASLDIGAYQRHSVKRSENLAIFTYEDDWSSIVQGWLRKCVDANDRRIANGKKPCELEIEIRTHYDDRSIEANALMWKIYEIQARVLNREGKEVKQITTRELYDQDMNDFAPVHTITVPKHIAPAVIMYAEKGGECAYRGHIIDRSEVFSEADGMREQLTFRETSSFWDADRFSGFLEVKIAELETMGKDRWNDGETKGIIDDFLRGLKEKKAVKN